jgi:PAS domain S-box-containing protein
MSDSEQRTLRTILTGMPGILALKNQKLAYEVVNPQFCQFLAKSFEEIIGKTDDGLFPAPEAAAAAKEQRSVLSSGISRRAELQLSGKDGPRWFDVSLSAVLDENGDPAGVMIAGHDVTMFKQREAAVTGAEARVAEAEKRAAESQEKLQQLHDEARELEVAAQQIQDHLKQREKQLAQSLKQVNTLEGQLADAQAALSAAESRASEASSALSAAERAAREAESRAERAQADCDEARGKLASIENEIGALRKQRQDAAGLARQLADTLS